MYYYIRSFQVTLFNFKQFYQMCSTCDNILSFNNKLRFVSSYLNIYKWGER